MQKALAPLRKLSRLGGQHVSLPHITKDACMHGEAGMNTMPLGEASEAISPSVPGLASNGINCHPPTRHLLPYPAAAPAASISVLAGPLPLPLISPLLDPATATSSS